MARRVGATETFGFTWQEAPRRAAPLDSSLDDPPIQNVDATPRTKARIAALRWHLAQHPAGLSFAKLCAASGLPAEDVRYALDIALRARLIRRAGARNSLVYLTNADAAVD
jgi:hypothetical protein